MMNLALVGLGLMTAPAQHVFAQSIFSGAGANTINARNDFRTAIGGVNNGAGVPATPDALKGVGRREISWDGVRLDGTDFGGNSTIIDLGKTVGIPEIRFQNTGNLYSDVFAVSGDGFASVNPSIAGQFNAFSGRNTFAAINGNTIDLSFVLASGPGTTPIAAGSRGFGAIFSDVELANTSSIELFNGFNSLGTYYVEPGANGEFGFLGILFDTPVITSVRLTLGNASLFNFNGSSFTPGGPENIAGGIDLAVTDDFIFAEPTAAVPEPSTYAMLGAFGIAAAGFGIRRRRTNR
jgi:hypothetical protein